VVGVRDIVKIMDRFRGIWKNILQMKNGEVKDANMSPFGLGNTRILTDCAQNFHWTSLFEILWFIGSNEPTNDQ
jgi:hypothetical protein